LTTKVTSLAVALAGRFSTPMSSGDVEDESMSPQSLLDEHEAVVAARTSEAKTTLIDKMNIFHHIPAECVFQAGASAFERSDLSRRSRLRAPW
jgi:hypothetical protein